MQIVSLVHGDLAPQWTTHCAIVPNMGLEKQNTTPLVSIIIPIYKVQDYLDDCIKSIVGQTYTNLEIILVDDGSPDGCGAMCDEWAKRDARVMALHKDNGGLSDARNYGLDHAHGDYVAFVDSDDRVEPQLVQDALHSLTEHNAQIVVYQYRFLYPNGDLAPDPGSTSFPAGQLCSAQKALEYIWQDRVQNFSWTIFAELSLYDDIRFPKGRLVEDMATTYRLFHAARAVYFLGEELIQYRVRSDSILSNSNQNIITDMAKNISEIDSFASHYYSDMVVIERNWAIRYITTDYLWLYQMKGELKLDTYHKLRHALVDQMHQEIADIGWKSVSRHNKLKVLAIKMRLMPLFARISAMRSGRASSF